MRPSCKVWTSPTQKKKYNYSIKKNIVDTAFIRFVQQFRTTETHKEDAFFCFVLNALSKKKISLSLEMEAIDGHPSIDANSLPCYV